MTDLLAATLIPAGYLAGWIYTARLLFSRWRPYAEPIKCRYSYGGHEHIQSCYERSAGALIGSAREAAVFALLASLPWPVFLAGFAVTGLVMRGAAPLPEETAAKIKRLERELNIRRGDS